LLGNTAAISLSPCGYGGKVSARTVPGPIALIAKKLDEQQIAAVAAYNQQVQATLEAVGAQGKD
jgi:hypothetical protein